VKGEIFNPLFSLHINVSFSISIVSRTLFSCVFDAEPCTVNLFKMTDTATCTKRYMCGVGLQNCSITVFDIESTDTKFEISLFEGFI
jgi:hypothetical protein